jgi:hypothetical protein
MNLSMFDRFYLSLKTMVLIDERIFDMNRYDMNSEIYVIPMHKNNVWTNKLMQDPRKNLLQISSHEPSA